MTKPVIIDNPNVKLIPVENVYKPRPIPKPKSRRYQDLPAGTRIFASDGIEYTKQKDGSLRRSVPKPKGKKKGKSK